MKKRNPRVTAIIQARMGSTRLPGKVMAPICGKPMMAHLMDRVARAETLTEICIATTTAAEDRVLMRLAQDRGMKVFAGSSEDVLDRYYQAAGELGGEVIVRLTGDCPLHDPGVIDRVVRTYLAGDFDYVSNTIPPTFPDGLDTEVFSFGALTVAWQKAVWSSEREHVTAFMKKHPEIFRLQNVVAEEDLSDLRWTVDEKEDLEFVRAVFEHFHPSFFGMEDLVALLRRRRDLVAMNKGILRDQGYHTSLKQDQIVKPGEESE